MIRRAILLGASILTLAAWVSIWTDVQSVLERRKPVSHLLSLSNAGKTNKGTLVVIFQPADCLRSDRMLEQWKRYQDAGTFHIVGRIVGDGTLSTEQDAGLRRKGLDFGSAALPMRSASLVAARLGYRDTPFVVLVDARGRIVGSFAGEDSVSVESINGSIGIERASATGDSSVVRSLSAAQRPRS